MQRAGVFFNTHVEGGEQIMTRDRVKKFLDITGMNKTVFCRKCSISSSMLQYYLKSERNISRNTENRINGFIDGYIGMLMKV